MKRAAKIAGSIAGAVAAALAIVLPVYAESATLTLTPNQTLALYGASFTADRYSMGEYVSSVTFQYVGKTSDYGSSQYGQNCSVLGFYNDSSVNTIGERAKINQYDYLIYKYDAHNWSSANSLNFTINIPADLQGITGYCGGFMVGVGDYQTAGTNYMYNSDVLYYTSKGQRQYYVNRNSNNGPVIAHIALSSPDSFGQVPDSDIVAVQYYVMQDPDMLRFDGQEFNTVSFSINYGSAGGPSWSAVTGWSTALYVFLPCPVLYDYAVPSTTVPVTGTTAATTRPAATHRYTLVPPVSTAPAHTVDLSNLESGVAAIVQQGIDANNNLDWIGNNMYIGVNNLSYIANRLDDIYAAMQRAGKVPVDSTGDLINGVQSGLTSYTTARIPDDARDGLTFWAWLMSKIMAQAWIASLAALGGFLAVTYFILFRGRNS